MVKKKCQDVKKKVLTDYLDRFNISVCRTHTTLVLLKKKNEKINVKSALSPQYVVDLAQSR